MTAEAQELNDAIKQESPAVFTLLSGRGRAIFFPKKGILAQAAQAKGKRLDATIGIAIENDGSPMRLKSIEKELNVPPQDVFPYAPSFGRADLRDIWKKMIFEKNPSLAGKQISLPVVTCALTHGLSMVGYLFADDNDAIIIPSPYWENYELVFDLAYGTRLGTFELFKGNRFNIEGLRSKLEQKGDGTKIVFFNFPNNPTGYTPSVSEREGIVRAILECAQKGTKIVVIIDDAYFGLVYEDAIEQESLFSYLAGLHENVLAVKIDGVTKEDYAWGLRVGFVTLGIKDGSPELYSALEAKLAGAVRGSISNASNLSQSLVVRAMRSPTYREEKKEKYDLLKSRYEAVKNALEQVDPDSYFVALPFNSGYFMCIQLNNRFDAEKIRKILLSKYDTGVIVSADMIRIAFSAIAIENILRVFENIRSACDYVLEGG